MRISLRRLGILAGALFLAFFALIYLIPYLIPFIAGLILSLILEPIIQKIERFTSLPRWLSVMIVLLLFLLFLIGGLTLLFSRITAELYPFFWEVPHYFDRFTRLLLALIPEDSVNRFYQRLIDWYAAFYPAGEEELKKNIAIWLNRGGEYFLLHIQRFLEGLLAILLKLPQITASFFLTLLASFFISLDLPNYILWLKKKSPPSHLKRAQEIGIKMREGVLQYVKAQLLMASVTAIGTTAGLFFLHLKYSLLLGLIAGLLDLIPLLGAGILFLPWIFYLFFSENHALVIGLTLLYLAITLIRQFLEPRLVARSIGLSPILIMISLFLGVNWFGIVGFILSPFLLILFLSLIRAGVFHDLYRFLQEK